MFVSTTLYYFKRVKKGKIAQNCYFFLMDLKNVAVAESSLAVYLTLKVLIYFISYYKMLIDNF